MFPLNLKHIVDVTIRCGGTLYDSLAFNVTSSTIGTAYSGRQAVKCIVKCLTTPSPLAKVCYASGAVCHTVSTTCGVVCLANKYSIVAPIPGGALAFGLIASQAGKACTAFAKCTDISPSAVCYDTILEN